MARSSTFTIGFEGEADERPFAESVARRYGTAHHADATKIDYIEAAREQARDFRRAIRRQFLGADASGLRFARRDVTVAVSGDGGDEIFAGYRRYQWHQLTEAVRSFLPARSAAARSGALAAIYPKLDRAPRWLRAKYTLTEISLDSALGFYRMVCKVHADQRRSLFASGLASRLEGYDPAARVTALMDEAGTDDPLLQAQYVDLHTWLVGDILVKVDRASMANSLEVRAPLLDYEFVQWAARLPASLKLRGREGKYIFKRAMERLSPPGDPLSAQARLRRVARDAIPARRRTDPRTAAFRPNAGLRPVRAYGDCALG